MRALLVLLLLVPSGISLDEFKKLHGEVRADADQAWRSIPWMTSILDAREKAEKEGKPVFMWSMDGHPMGCT